MITRPLSLSRITSLRLDQNISQKFLRRFEHATKLAKETNTSTIEMTSGGKWLHELKLFKPQSGVARRDAIKIWRKASAKFAMAASGKITVFEVNRSYKDMRKSAYRSVEKRITENFDTVTAAIYKECKSES